MKTSSCSVPKTCTHNDTGEGKRMLALLSCGGEFLRLFLNIKRNLAYTR